MVRHWSTELFAECYQSIKSFNEVDLEVINTIKEDLKNILVVPERNSSSRDKLIDQSKPIEFSDGQQYKLNPAFTEGSIILSTELGLDEIVTAELLFHSSTLEYEKGTLFIDSARLEYYSRQLYILNIVGFLLENDRLGVLLGSGGAKDFFDTVLKSFERIYKTLDLLNDLTDKQKVTDLINDLSFISGLNFTRNQLFTSHELLGQILFTLISNYKEFNHIEYYQRVTEFMYRNLNDDDNLIYHFLPALFKFVSKEACDFGKFYPMITSKLSKDYNLVHNQEVMDLSKSELRGFEIVTMFIYITNFVEFCKELEEDARKYNFKDDMLKYSEWCINFGVMDKILCYSADTATDQTKELLDWSNLYDFRSLLQKTYPKLTPIKFSLRISSELLHLTSIRPDLQNVPKLLDVSNFKVSLIFTEKLIVPFFHSFFTLFIVNLAIVLTLLRDNEEDFLLSSNQSDLVEDIDFKGDDSGKAINERSELDLDEMSSRADLERFYLAFAYCYNNRPDICSLFLLSEDYQSEVSGFFSWGLSNNTSPLIASTFCLLLGSLGSGGPELAFKIWEILMNNNNSTLKKNDYSKISMDSIVDSLCYYIDSLNENFQQEINEQLRLQQKRQDLLFSSQANGKYSDDTSNEFSIELAEDSVTFISGFIQLISSIVKNLTSRDNEKFKEAKSSTFNRFKSVIIGFLKFDNLIMASKGNWRSINSSSNTQSSFDEPVITISDENRVVLTNLLMNFLADFASLEQNMELRYQVWNILDGWLYRDLMVSSSEGNKSKGTTTLTDDSLSGPLALLNGNNRSKFSYTKFTVGIKQGFSSNLTHFSQVVNFTRLLYALLMPSEDENQAFTKYVLLYPENLGENYRLNGQIGVWPYIEYLMLEVFPFSHKLPDVDDKINLQSIIIEIIKNSLYDVDWVFLNDIAPHSIKDVRDLNIVVSHNNDITFDLFVKLHHSLAVLNYLYDEKAYKTLAGILNAGLDVIEESNKSAYLVDNALAVLLKVLELQDIYTSRLLPILKNVGEGSQKPNMGHGFNSNMSIAWSAPKSVFDNIYHSRYLGMNSVNNFYEILLFNLSTVANMALYVGTSVTGIAEKSVNILDKLSSSDVFVSKVDDSSNDPLLAKNRLLTIFESIDESVKIKYAFIEQFEDIDCDLRVKYNILDFLIGNLERSNGKVPTVSHFLLGYQIRGGNLSLHGTQKTNTLLKSLLKALDFNLKTISEIDYVSGNIQYINEGPVKLSSLILATLVTLSRHQISGTITLDFLRDYGNLFEKLVEYQPKVDQNTIFGHFSFNGDLQDATDNKFLHDDGGRQAFLSFIDYRNLTMQYFSLEFHSVASITRKDIYKKVLLGNWNYFDGSPKVLSFLDVLNYEFQNFEAYKYESYNERFNLSLLFREIRSTKPYVLDMTVLKKLIRFTCQSTRTIGKEDRASFAKDVMFDAYHLSEYLMKFAVSEDLKEAQFRCLHSWCQLIEVLISDHMVDPKGFVLEIFQVVLPKINDYLETEIAFSEEFISLSVLLFHVYEHEILSKSKREEFSVEFHRLLPFFKTCISGILNTNTTPNLRSNLYVLTNKFLANIFENSSLVKMVSSIIKSTDRRLLDVVSNDSVYSEGSSRITSILLLESLVHLTSFSKNNFVLNHLISNNTLLMLVQSIKRTDEMVTICSSNNSGINLQTLLYELTAFKATMYFLIRVAQSKNGSLHLIQSDLIRILKESKFLKIDPDLGLTLKLENFHDYKNIKINLSLDTPFALSDFSKRSGEENDISYFEFLNPTIQLVVAVLISMGPSFKPSIVQARELLNTYHSLMVGVMKREYLLETRRIDGSNVYREGSVSRIGLQELVKLFTILDSLVHG